MILETLTDLRSLDGENIPGKNKVRQTASLQQEACGVFIDIFFYVNVKVGPELNLTLSDSPNLITARRSRKMNHVRQSPGSDAFCR